jgi:hypothetical protein
MIETIPDTGFAWGQLGFIDSRFVEDVIDGGELKVVDIVYPDGSVVKQIITENWFREFRNKLVLIDKDLYSGVTYKGFLEAFMKDFEGNEAK